MNKIIWKKIIIDDIAYDYEISNTGIVRNINNLHNLSYGLRGKINHRYPFVILYKNGQPKHYSVHRLVANAFIPNPENKPQVNHIDGNKLNNNVSNLEWVTNKENIEHAIINKLIKIPGKGINAYNCKHTEKDVRNVCELLAQHKPINYIAKELNLSIGFISGIKYQKNWSDIRKEYNLPESRIINYRSLDEIHKLYDIFKQGIRNKHKIINLMNWPNNKSVIRYIKYQLYKWKQLYGSTTIDQLGFVD